MRIVELFRCLHTYNEAKDRLAEAERDMATVRSYADLAHRFPMTFGLTDKFIIDSISEFKKAHAAYQNLFIDHEMYRELELLVEGIKARSAMLLSISESVKKES